MTLELKPAPKPLVWIGNSLEAVKSFPQAVRSEVGFALYQVQTGGKHVNAKPLRGFGAGVLEIVSDHRGDTFRAVYTVRLAGRVYVLHPFRRNRRRGSQRAKRRWNW